MRTGVLLAVTLWAVVAGIAPANPYEAPAAAAAQTEIDLLVFSRLQKLGITPASVCSDAVFVRRVYLDVIGTLPPAAEAVAFIDDTSPKKRQLLIDKLLERDEFADYWALKWGDLLRVKAEFPVNLWPNAVQAYHRYIHTALKQNLPYDRFARELLTASGSNFRVGQVNFWRAVQNKDPNSLAQTVALTFMGTRADRWPTNQLAGMSAFFGQVGYKTTAEWKEEIVYFNPALATNNPTGTATFPDGKTVTLGPDRDPREVFAEWLITPRNPWFTRNIANRVWSWLIGRGVIHEPDDIRPDNPPANPELLAYLENQLIAARYDLKQLYRLILNSRTYQLSAIPRSQHAEAGALFASYPLRRLEAEVLIDAINQITGTTEEYSSPIPEPFTFIPKDQRSIALADGSITSTFLELFGRSSRDTGLESERNSKITAGQKLHLLNSSHMQRKIENGPKMQALLRSRGAPRDVATKLYLTILSRYPTEDELRTVMAYIPTGSVDNRNALVDVAWALINSAEFSHRH